MHMAMKKACSKTDKIKIASSTNKITFREKVRNETGLDIYALGNSALALGGAVGSAAAMGLGILAAPETGGASLALTAFGFGSLAFACSDLSQYLSDVYVGKDGEFRHGTENRSYNAMHDGLFNGNTTAYNNVRTFTDLGTTIFSIGTAAVTTPKTPAQNINNTANKNKYNNVSSVNNQQNYKNALNELNENKVNHIINGSKNSNHHWENLTPDKDWNTIKDAIEKTLQTGTETSYKSVYSKTATVKGNTVQVTYNVLQNGTIKISDAWIVE